MNIVFLSVLFRHPEKGEKVGGGEISNRRLLEALAENHQVTVLSAVGNNLKGEQVQKVTYYDYSATGFLCLLPGVLSRLASKWLYRRNTGQALKKIKPDIILCSTLEFNAALPYAKANNIPVGAFIRAFENFKEYDPKSIGGKIKRVFRNCLYGDTQDKTINKLDFVLPNSDFMAEKCQAAFCAPSRYVIYPPVDLIGPQVVDLDSVKENTIRSVVMVSGAQKKGGHLFIELSRRFPAVKFSIIGYRGELSDDLKPSNLQLHGWVSNPEALIAQADLVLVPSIWEEPFGRIAVEGLLSKKPVLASNIGGLPETVAYRAYLLVEPGNVPAWQAKLEECFNCSNTLIEESRIAMASAQKYSMFNQIKNLEAAMINEIGMKAVPK